MEAFRQRFLGADRVTLEQIGARLGGTVPQVKRWIEGARQVFSETLRSVAAESLENEEDLESEVGYLLSRCDLSL
jgi:hypothetical protein